MPQEAVAGMLGSVVEPSVFHSTPSVEVSAEKTLPAREMRSQRARTNVFADAGNSDELLPVELREKNRVPNPVVVLATVAAITALFAVEARTITA